MRATARSVGPTTRPSDDAHRAQHRQLYALPVTASQIPHQHYVEEADELARRIGVLDGEYLAGRARQSSSSLQSRAVGRRTYAAIVSRALRRRETFSRGRQRSACHSASG
jgi:hypothetical protein